MRSDAAGAVRRTCYSDQAGSIARKCARARGCWCGHMRLIRRVQIFAKAILAAILAAATRYSAPSTPAFYLPRSFRRSAGDESEFIAYIMDDVRGITCEDELIIIKLVSKCSTMFDPH